MPGFELNSPPGRSWVALSRDLVATAATPLDLPVDRLADLLVLTTHLLTESLDSSADDPVKIMVKADTDSLDFEMTTPGQAGPIGRVSQVALDTLADRHWTNAVNADQVVGFSFLA